MIRRTLFFVWTVAATACASAMASPLELWEDIDPHASVWTFYLYNTTDAPLSISGYQINSPNLDFDPAAWRSLSDWLATEPNAALSALGVAAPGFQELVASTARISEENPLGFATIPPRSAIPIGSPFKSGHMGFIEGWGNYTVPGSNERLFMRMGILPEPSTLLLATLAGLGLLGVRFKSRRRNGNGDRL
jgi:hypothetical protein